MRIFLGNTGMATRASPTNSAGLALVAVPGISLVTYVRIHATIDIRSDQESKENEKDYEKEND